MRVSSRKVAFAGEQNVGVSDALREYGYRTESVDADSVIGLARSLHRMRPAVIHARKSHLKVSLAAKLLNIPVLLQVGRADVTQSTARAARMAARTLCGGALVREALVKLGAPVSTTCILRSLLEVESDLNVSRTFPPMLDPAIRWVVAASPLDGPDRGHQDLLLAFLMVARTRPNLKLLIAGEGAEAQKLRTQAHEAGMSSRVVVHPVSLEQLPGVFARAATVVAPSRSGNLPDPVPEALAVGGRVLATAVGSHPIWIREGRTGFLVPARAPVALAARLAQILDDPELATRIGENACKASLELASPRAVAQELARCYRVIGQMQPRRSPLFLGPRSLQRA